MATRWERVAGATVNVVLERRPCRTLILLPGHGHASPRNPRSRSRTFRGSLTRSRVPKNRVAIASAARPFAFRMDGPIDFEYNPIVNRSAPTSSSRVSSAAGDSLRAHPHFSSVLDFLGVRVFSLGSNAGCNGRRILRGEDSAGAGGALLQVPFRRSTDEPQTPGGFAARHQGDAAHGRRYWSRVGRWKARREFAPQGAAARRRPAHAARPPPHRLTDVNGHVIRDLLVVSTSRRR